MANKRNIDNNSQTQPNENNTNQRDLDTIKKDIDQYQENYAQSFLEIGKLLIEAKSAFGKHGDWLSWLKVNVDMSVSKAQRLMRVAEKFANTAPVPFLDYTKAYILSALPVCEMDKFMDNLHKIDGEMKYVKNMSKRELETVVRNQLKSRKKKSPQSQLAKKTKLSTSSGDVFTTRMESIKNTIEELVELLQEQPDDLGTHDMLVAELRDLCNDTIQKLPSEELETI